MSRGPSEGREMEVSAVPLGENSAQTEGAVVLFHDVTQLRQVEEMRRDFVANVSHELRTPLSIFRGYLETLLDDPQQPPGELLRILEIMERHSDRLNALVEDVLSLARLESPGMELNLSEVNLAGLLHAIDSHGPAVRRHFRADLSAITNTPIGSSNSPMLYFVRMASPTTTPTPTHQLSRPVKIAR